jgi:hypothetical protein
VSAPSPRASTSRLLALALALGALSSQLGCTITTVPVLPDAGPLPDAQVDATLEPMDGGLPPPVVDTCTDEGMGSTIGEPCAGDTACNDGCFCNGAERCVDGACAAGEDPCPDEVDCTADVCLEESNRCFHDPQPEMCADGDACNGSEICDLLFGCTASAPLYCNDESSCTVDSCDPAAGCQFAPRDLDGDGFTDGRCGGDDCDDDPRFGADIYPGAPESCSNRRDDDCDGMRDFYDDECLPTNDSCASATVLPGPGTYSGSTRALGADFSLSCRSMGGADSVFRITLTEAHDLTITVAGGGSGAGVALRPWASCAIGPDLRCTAGNPPSLVVRSVPAGEYAILVQTPTGVPFELNIREGAPTVDPPGDTCPSAVDITAGPGTANIPDLLQDGLPSCSPMSTGYRDAYFYFELAATQDVTVSTSVGTSFHYIALQETCGDRSTELRCWSGGSTPMQLWRSLPAGRYYIAASTSLTTGTVTASVDIRPPTPIPPNDRCSGAVLLTSGTSRGDTTIGFADDARGGTCASTGRIDAFYTFTLPTSQLVLISVSDADAGSTDFALTVRGDCGSPSDSSSAACVTGSRVATINQTLPAGTYYLLVETYSTDSSDYTIRAAFF